MNSNLQLKTVLLVAALFFLIFTSNIHAQHSEQVSVGITLQNSKYIEIIIEKNNSIINKRSGSPIESLKGAHVFFWHRAGIKVEGPAGDINVFSGPLKIQEGKDKEYIQVNGASQGDLYRGSLLIERGEEGLVLVNVLDLEEYLYGVLPREMPPSWGSSGGMEALKAQAVAARTYALVRSGSHKMYDLCDTDHCQVYGGMGNNSEIREHDNTNQAVDATRGQVLLFQGEPILPFYHATSGGYTEVPQNVWHPEASYQYFKSKEDPFDDHTNPLNIRDFIIHNRSRWDVQMPATVVEEKLFAAGIEVGRVTDLEVRASFPSKRVKELVIKGTEGHKSLFREKTRTAFSLNSQMYYVEEGDKSEVWLQSAEGKPVVKKSLDGKYAVTANGSTSLRGSELYALSASTLEKVPQMFFRFTGWGWGHGIGMSQNGAYNRARYGYSHEEILQFYYPGTKLIGNYNK